MANENRASKSQADMGIYTETLARLYCRQGFLEKALVIYRHLLGLQPDNVQLREQVDTLEQQLAGMAPSSTPMPIHTVHEALPETVSLSKPDPILQLVNYLEGWLHYLQQRHQSWPI